MGLTEKIESEIIRAKGFVFTPSDKVATREKIASMIDHTLLSPDATNSQIESLCVEAVRYSFHSVCVNPVNVPLAFKKLSGTDVKIASVVAFPFGATAPFVKAAETRWVVDHGADEIDMVINIGALKDERYEDVYEDIRAVVEEARDKTVKVIIETALLNFEQKVAACVISKEAGTHFVKTSTGYSKGGATAEDVALMKFVVGDKMEVKASGGIHSFEDALKMFRAGATRIGASHSVEIVTK
jgi:deoxyribose-phosphate aldolase